MHRRKRGNYWEDFAADYLIQKGYKILSRNWTCRWGEIDIIAQKSQKLVFVEVKFKSSQKFGNPFEAINLRKLQNQTKAIKIFLLQQNAINKPWQFDVIGISKEVGRPKLQHFKAVPLPL